MPLSVAEISAVADFVAQQATDPENPRGFTLQTSVLGLQNTSNGLYRVEPYTEDAVEAGQFRATDSQNPQGSTTRHGVKYGELVPLGLRMPITEEDFYDMGEDKADEVRVRYARLTMLGTIARMELAVAESLMTGVINLDDERGITQTVDWGRNANRTVTVGASWMAAGDPLADLRAIQDVIGRSVPLEMRMNSATFSMLLTNAKMKQLVMPANVTAVSTSLAADPASVSAFFATQQLPTPVLYNAEVTNSAGAKIPILPDGKIVISPRNVKVGATWWGRTREHTVYSQELVEAQLTRNIITHTYRSDHPVQEWVNTAGFGFPTLASPDLTACLTVNP